MKLFLPLFLSVFFGLNTFAQQAQFYFEPDSISITVASDVVDAPAELEIHSTAAADVTIKWQRYVLSMTGGCLTKVCDLNVCYPETFNSREFVISPNQTGPISVHLVNNNGNLCQGVVRLDMWNVEDADPIIVPSFFLFNATTSVNEIFKLDEVKVYPNPATEYFTIENDNVARIRMTTLDAREVAAFDATQTKTFSLAGQTAGMYVLVMEDAKVKAIGVAQLDVK